MIDRIGTNKARDAYATRAEEAKATRRTDRDRSVTGAGGASTGEAEAVAVSEGLRQIQRATEAVRTSPDVRADRVAELRRRIEAGEYHVPAEKVAAKLLGLGDDQS